MSTQLLLIAKAPVAGRVNTRMCPPCTPEQAAEIAAASLSDTMIAMAATPAVRHTLILSGQYRAPQGWYTVPQRGNGLAERLANGFVETALPGVASLLVGMDTPQLTPELLDGLTTLLAQADAVVAPAADGGWWALGMHEPRHANVLRQVRMSTPDTCKWTAAALRAQSLRLRFGPTLRDVDTADDAIAVAPACKQGAFTAAVNSNLSPAAIR